MNYDLVYLLRSLFAHGERQRKTVVARRSTY